MLTELDVTHELAKQILRLGTAKRVAEAALVSPQFVCDVMSGRRAPTGPLLAYLGCEQVVGYRRTRRRRR